MSAPEQRHSAFTGRLPLEKAISQFIDHYNHRRCHESIGNVTPADAYFGRAPKILEERRKIKEETFKLRRLHNQAQAA